MWHIAIRSYVYIFVIVIIVVVVVVIDTPELGSFQCVNIDNGTDDVPVDCLPSLFLPFPPLLSSVDTVHFVR